MSVLGGPSAKVCLPSFVYHIQGIYALLLRGPSAKVCSSAKFCLPSFVYQYSRHLCSINGGVHLPKYVHLPSFVYWYSRHLCSINGGPSAKVGSSAKFGVVVFKASMLYYLGGRYASGSANYQSWPLDVSTTEGHGVDLPGDLPRSALTAILHITPGKYEPS